MLTRLQIRNFKRFEDVDIELGPNVVFIGPNNSGKTTALQALALWETGVRKWVEKKAGTSSSAKRAGVAINRRDLIAVPVPVANLLWRDLNVQRGVKVGGPPKSKHVLIEIVVDGVTDGVAWSCGFEFDHANDESFYCRPLRLGEGDDAAGMPVPEAASRVRIAFLPAMSGLAATEPKWEIGRVQVLIGEGQTAQTLRNLCLRVFELSDSHVEWTDLKGHIRRLFGVELDIPQHIQERGEITMSYRERGMQLDLSSSGRGLQQALLLLAYLYTNPSTVLLLDEPDAHLEVLRQQQIYQLITTLAAERGSQIIAASHSEVVLQEAVDRDVVVAFVGRPHRVDDRGSQVYKALRDISFDQYLQAEIRGWVLYVEGATDLAILQALARTLGHAAANDLDGVFFHPLGSNQPQKARDHFFGLREAKEDFVGVALLDRLEKNLQTSSALVELMWSRREIENYVCTEEVLLRYARHELPDDLFGHAESGRREQAMRESIGELTDALRLLHRESPWSPDTKVTDRFLDPLFELYFAKLGLENLLRKTDYHVLASLVKREEIDPEVTQKLDAIHSVAMRAKPRAD